MKSLTVKSVIEFKRKKTDKSKKTFIENLKSPKIESAQEGGGDYWISALSAITESYKKNTNSAINSKINSLQEKLKIEKRNITKNMYFQNISILEKYKKINLKSLRPKEELTFIKKSSGNSLLSIKGFQIASTPSLIFSFGTKSQEQIGAIWFTAKVHGYSIEEVGMFCDLLYRFLDLNFAKKYAVIPKYCIAIDTFSSNVVTYADIMSGKCSQVLSSTFDEMGKFM